LEDDVMTARRSEILPEVVIVEPKIFRDNRGFFLETYRENIYRDWGIPDRFVQDNYSYSVKGVLRGLHYQLGKPQGKLVWTAQGEIFDVAVDIRKGSPGFGKWEGQWLSAENQRQLYIPPGFAHGFCVKSEYAVVIYKCTRYYAPKEERGIRWDDPRLGIDWPPGVPLVSEKDKMLPALEQALEEDLPTYAVP
jgi:dTDP-4-dehydrorhamnose 3,5-epimerase